MTDDAKRLFRATVAKHLAALRDDLGRFEQTTHARVGVGRVEDVAGELVRAWNDPRAFTASELDQVIDAFLKAQVGGPR